MMRTCKVSKVSYRAWGFAAGSSALGGVGIWYLLRPPGTEGHGRG